MARLAAPAVTAAGALLAWAMVGTGFANYDTAYALLWGSDLAHGRMPDYSVPVAPTPHPLATAAGVVLSPLGDGAETVVVVAAFGFLGALGYVTYALGREVFGVAAGVIAALVMITREPVLSFGVRAYVDIPYVVLVLAALLVEVRRPRAGARVLVLLGVAGLLRPEAWLFAAAYWLWLAAARDRPPAELARLAALAAAAPAIWALSDWAIAGDPLYSLTGTQENADVLRRRTGLDEVPVTVPRRLGEILREPVLAAAVLGAVALYPFRGRRVRALAAAGVVALGAFCVLAAAGLPILGRYLLLPAALIAILAGGGMVAWRSGDRRRAWAVGAALCAVLFVAFTPKQIDRIDRLRAAIGLQREIRDDLHAIARPHLCPPIAVPNHRPVPLLALWLERRPDSIVSAQLRRPGRGTFLAPATGRVERNFILDRNDPGRLDADVPAGFERRTANRSWIVFHRC